VAEKVSQKSWNSGKAMDEAYDTSQPLKCIEYFALYAFIA